MLSPVTSTVSLTDTDSHEFSSSLSQEMKMTKMIRTLSMIFWKEMLRIMKFAMKLFWTVKTNKNLAHSKSSTVIQDPFSKNERLSDALSTISGKQFIKK